MYCAHSNFLYISRSLRRAKSDVTVQREATARLKVSWDALDGGHPPPPPPLGKASLDHLKDFASRLIPPDC